MDRKLLDEAFGWYGTIAILAAYALLSFGFIQTGLVYQVLNATGALGIVYISFKKRNYQPGVLNVFWAVIAVIAIIRLIFSF